MRAQRNGSEAEEAGDRTSTANDNEKQARQALGLAPPSYWFTNAGARYDRLGVHDADT